MLETPGGNGELDPLLEVLVETLSKLMLPLLILPPLIDKDEEADEKASKGPLLAKPSSSTTARGELVGVESTVTEDAAEENFLL